jgi:hypothetical protein
VPSRLISIGAARRRPPTYRGLLPDQQLPRLRTPLGMVAFVPLHALYGTALGSALVFAGACLGAELVFLLGRGRWRERARRRLAVEQAVCGQGLLVARAARRRLRAGAGLRPSQPAAEVFVTGRAALAGELREASDDIRTLTRAASVEVREPT